jgi:hypothetical protein
MTYCTCRCRQTGNRSEILSAASVIAFAGKRPSAETFAHGDTLIFEERTMNAHRIYAFLAAILITVGQTLIFATDTAASAQGAEPSVAMQPAAHAGSGQA